MKNGPREIVIPEQRYLTCGTCTFYNYSMIKSGQNPTYRANCCHPEVFTSLQSFHVGNLSGSSKTPDWCPFLTSTRRKVLTEKNK